MAKYVMRIELELPTDEEGLTDGGWAVYDDLQRAIEKLQDDYGYKEIQRVRMPIRAETD